MNPSSIHALLNANALLPQCGRRSYGKLLCVLAFVNAWSASWRSQAAKLDGYTPAKKAIAMAAAGQLNMTEQTLFDAFCPVDADSILTLEAAQALLPPLYAALNQLAAANPTLQGVFQAWHFIHLQSTYTQAKAKPHTLAKVIAYMGQVKIEHPVPSLAGAQEFGKLMATTCQNNPITACGTAALMAQLINPQPNDVVVDFVCGPGNLLLACAAHLAQTQPGAALHLHGMVQDLDDWGLAKMWLALAGQPHHAIQQRNALTGSFKDFSEPEKKLALCGANVVVMVVPAHFTPWGHALAFEEQDPRFKVRPPIDSRLALAWIGLAAMNPNGGRMALLIPTNAFLALGNLELRKHMVALNWLDAVITLPGIDGYVLLMLHTQKVHTHIGFIQTKCPITSDTDDDILAVLDAWQHYQTGAAHPSVVKIARETVATNHYEFDVKRYAASATMHHAEVLEENA